MAQLTVVVVDAVVVDVVVVDVVVVEAEHLKNDNITTLNIILTIFFRIKLTSAVLQRSELQKHQVTPPITLLVSVGCKGGLNQKPDEHPL